MRLTTIPIHQILSLAQQFCKERPSRKKKFGRPLIYPEYLILTLFALKQVYRLSYRQIPSFVRDELGNIPCLSTLHYRVKKIQVFCCLGGWSWKGLIDCFFPRMKEDFSNILNLS
jgi:hypothetical protein